ncbi:MAG: hypothetical protein LUG93_10260 [Lachnospiraceae bacterium]|nr:hypothetical protein [Lachnospiraceae bacterium]
MMGYQNRNKASGVLKDGLKNVQKNMSKGILADVPVHMTPELNKAINDYMQTVHFDEAKEHIYLYPLEYLKADTARLATIQDLQKSCPSFILYGFAWFYIIDLSEVFPVRFWEYLDEEMVARWEGISEEKVREAALENINRKRLSVRETEFMDGCAYPHTPIAVHELAMQDVAAVPSYGCSLMLSDEYLDWLHEEFGDYYLFPYSDHTLYLIAAYDVINAERTAQECFASVAAAHQLTDSVLSDRMLFVDSDFLR